MTMFLGHLRHQAYFSKFLQIHEKICKKGSQSQALKREGGMRGLVGEARNLLDENATNIGETNESGIRLLPFCALDNFVITEPSSNLG